MKLYPKSTEMSFPGFRPVASALRTPRAASPPKTVTFSDTNVVHHFGKTQSSRHDDLPKTITQHLKEIITGVDEGKGQKRRDRRRLGRMPEARVRNARKHGELNFGPERKHTHMKKPNILDFIQS